MQISLPRSCYKLMNYKGLFVHPSKVAIAGWF